MSAPLIATAAQPAGSEIAAIPAAGRRHKALILLVTVQLTVLYAPTLAWLWDRWTLSVWHHAHGLLIPPVVAYFIYQELRQRRSLPRDGSKWGFAVVIPALSLHALDAGMHTQLLSAISLVLLLPGLSLLTIGVAHTRAILIPLSLLAFALPIPLALTEQVHWQLRQLATAAAAWLLPAIGVNVFVEGTTLHLAQGSLHIADACSGFSTLYAAAAVASLTAYSTPSGRRRAVVLLAAGPVAIAANVLRVLLLAVLVVWQGESILLTSVHPLSGVLTFVLALPIILWLGRDSHRER